jgi:hypothetical protein
VVAVAAQELLQMEETHKHLFVMEDKPEEQEELYPVAPVLQEKQMQVPVHKRIMEMPVILLEELAVED